MYTVYDTGRPARFPDISVDPTWSVCSFDTWNEALVYAKMWLGQWQDVLPQGWDGSIYDYNGYGDTIEIRKEG